MYNLSKHVVTALTRSLGRQLQAEKITMNAFCPSSIRTNFTSEAYYEQLVKEDLLTPMDGVLEVVEKTLGTADVSGECYEIGPNYEKVGLVSPKWPDYADDATARIFELINLREGANR